MSKRKQNEGDERKTSIWKLQKITQDTLGKTTANTNRTLTSQDCKLRKVLSNLLKLMAFQEKNIYKTLQYMFDCWKRTGIAQVEKR